MEKVAKITRGAEYFTNEVVEGIKSAICNYPPDLKINLVECGSVKLADVLKYNASLFVSVFSTPQSFCSAFVTAVAAVTATS